MSSPRRARQRSARPWLRWLLWSLGVVPVLLLVAYFGARLWVENYLRSDEFRRFVSRRIARTLHAESEFASLSFSGLNIFSDGFKARGGEAAAFSTLALEQLRAELSLRRWSERVWQIEHLEAQRLDLQFTGSRVALAHAPEVPTLEYPWLPNRVEIGRALIREMNIGWEAGSLRQVALEATPNHGAWNVALHGGRLEHAGLPTLELEQARLLFTEHALFVQSSALRQGTVGTMSVDGEVRFNEALDLRAQFAGLDLKPFLNRDWRVRLHGSLAGDVRVHGPLPAELSSQQVSGSLRLMDGKLEAMPVLDGIAEFTRLQQYRNLALTRATTDFQYSGSTFRATNCVVESAGLIKLEGAFSVAGGMIDGTFQVGVTSASLQWLPGSQTRVFTEARDGYLWTPMRLTGPVEKPQEDLTPRLMVAVKDAALEKVENTVQDAVKTGKDLIKGAADLVLPLFK